jgi:hypothetical protein
VGVVQPSSVYSTGITWGNLTNNSSFAIDVLISCGNMTGGTTWVISDTATPGSNIFGIKAGVEGIDQGYGLFIVGSSSMAAYEYGSYVVGASSMAAYDYGKFIVGSTSAETYSIIAKGSETYNYLIENLLAGNSVSWGLSLWTPTGTFSDGTPKEGTVTLWAEAH